MKYEKEFDKEFKKLTEITGLSWMDDSFTINDLKLFWNIAIELMESRKCENCSNIGKFDLCKSCYRKIVLKDNWEGKECTNTL